MQRALRSGTARRMLTRIKDAGSHQMIVGSAVVLVAVIALAATTLLYVRPPGRKTVAFSTTDAASLNTGEEVRVAGIAVGKITKITIEPTTVRVEAQVDDSTFIGNDSRVDVRMLTPVGGYAVTIDPIGRTQLGDSVIPVDHVSVPYSIGDVLQAAPNVTDKVNGGTVDANIDQVSTALQHNSTSIASMISGMNSIATVMDHQREQVRRVMDMASEYLQTFNGSREFVFDLIRQVDVVLTTYDNVHDGFDRAYQLLGDVLYRVEPLERFYLEHKQQILAAVTQLRGSIADFQKNMGPAIDKLQTLRNRLSAWMTPQGMATIGGGTITAAQLCVPVPGRTC